VESLPNVLAYPKTYSGLSHNTLSTSEGPICRLWVFIRFYYEFTQSNDWDFLLKSIWPCCILNKIVTCFDNWSCFRSYKTKVFFDDKNCFLALRTKKSRPLWRLKLGRLVHSIHVLFFPIRGLHKVEEVSEETTKRTIVIGISWRRSPGWKDTTLSFSSASRAWQQSLACHAHSFLIYMVFPNTRPPPFFLLSSFLFWFFCTVFFLELRGSGKTSHTHITSFSPCFLI